MKKLLVTAVTAVLLLAGAAGFALWQVQRYMAAPVQVPVDGRNFEIVPGSSFSSVTGDLVDAGIIDDDTLLRLYARWTGEEGAIQAGEYRIEPGATQEYVLALIGEPTTRTKLSTGGSVWKWEFSEKVTRKGHVLFVVNDDSTKETRGATYVEFDTDGLVTASWRD